MAYIPHHDWFDAAADAKWNFDPATGGSNRFATVFLYLNDVEEGGQTGIICLLVCFFKKKIQIRTNNNT